MINSELVEIYASFPKQSSHKKKKTNKQKSSSYCSFLFF